MKKAMIGIATAAIALGSACAYAAPTPVQTGVTFEGTNVVKAHYYRHGYYWHRHYYPYRWHAAYYHPYRWHHHHRYYYYR